MKIVNKQAKVIETTKCGCQTIESNDTLITILCLEHEMEYQDRISELMDEYDQASKGRY